jgi:hypothetical protein
MQNPRRFQLSVSFLSLCLLLTLALRPLSAPAASAVFGGGPFYSGGTSVMNILRGSGFTTVILWCIHVDSSTGNLIYNDQLIVANGVYVGNSSWPSQLATLKNAPTSVNRIEVSVGSWGVDDFGAIRTLMNTYGTNTTSLLYSNFLALKNATGATAVDFDDEVLYDATSTVAFGRMLSYMGYKVTLCPYTGSSFWQSVYSQLGTGIVDRVYLQCYAGGAGNSPSTWNSYFAGTKVMPGMWCLNSGCSAGSSPSTVATQMTSWRASAGIPGGFMWLYDDMVSCTSQGTVTNYAYAINQAVDDLQITPASGFSAAAANTGGYLPASTPFVLTNTGVGSLGWSLVNTTAWVSVSAAIGTLAASGSSTVTVSLNSSYATNLAPGQYTATIWFSNTTTKVGWPRTFTLNTAVANWPITFTGYNAAILASNNATAAAPGVAAFDIPNNFCFYQAGLSGSTRGLPATGSFVSLCDTSTAFRLGPYGANDVVLLASNLAKSATVTLTTPRAYTTLAVLATSANGSSSGQGTLVLNFSDGTKSPALSFNAQDWFYVTSNVAAQGFGRLKLDASLTVDDNGASNPNLYQTTFNLGVMGLAKPISSILFSNAAAVTSRQSTAILAISGMDASTPLASPRGLTAIPGTNKTVLLTWQATPGATNYSIKRAVVKGGPYTTNLGGGLATNYTAAGLANGTIYYFTVSSVGVSGESTNATEVSARPGSYLGWLWAQNPAAYWPLNETSGTTARELVLGSNGVHGGSVIPGVSALSGAGFDATHRGAYYNGSSSYTQVPLLVGSTNFSIVFWVLTANVGGTTNWYNGKGLVDGEVSGAAADFGVALVGAKVGFGIGNTDTTLTSAKSINDNVWHQVAVTWNCGTGAMKIYLDGALNASGTGPTGARTAPPSLRLASLQTGASGGFLGGSLSDVSMFNQELSATQIATLYRSASGLFYNVTLTNSWSGQNLVLAWPGNAKLMEATNLSGPWTTNATASPVTVTPNLPMKFYRLVTP